MSENVINKKIYCVNCETRVEFIPTKEIPFPMRCMEDRDITFSEDPRHWTCEENYDVNSHIQIFE